MTCCYCDKAATKVVYFDSGCQIGFKYICDNKDCENKFFNYLQGSGFEQVENFQYHTTRI